MRSVVAWSRILDRREVLCAINTDPVLERTAWVTVDAALHAPGESLALRYGSAPASVAVEARNGSRRADHPAAGGGGGVRVTPSGAAGMIRRSRSAASPSTRSASW